VALSGSGRSPEFFQSELFIAVFGFEPCGARLMANSYDAVIDCFFCWLFWNLLAKVCSGLTLARRRCTVLGRRFYDER